ncbi:hypothetical protein FNV43_RR07468 [Rhamnella rubrinervis]|uniref:Alpha-ketoglutarate-dependent dioxygenase AlkB-like domain-containing protein n=1 Tax=Rhamnella rubrinervis TaxID=2594499 RepID=A0A8K0MMR9_9ROSA|nr:hypothetical protein FNV43_RR07468 [Rhamnella rubrinervis]
MLGDHAISYTDKDGNAELIMVDSIPILYKNQPLRHAAMGMDVNPKSCISEFASHSSSSWCARIGVSSISGFTNQLEDLSFPTRFGKKRNPFFVKKPNFGQSYSTGAGANYSSDLFGDMSKVKGFDICLSGSKKSGRKKCGSNKSGSKKCRNKKSRLHVVSKWNNAVLRPGMSFFKEFCDHLSQVDIVRKCRTLGVGPGGFYEPVYKDGAKFDVQMMCLGLNWNPERLTYEFIRSVDGCDVPPIPAEFRYLAGILIDVAQIRDVIPSFFPNTCIVSFYSAAIGKLGLHQDCSERRERVFLKDDQLLTFISVIQQNSCMGMRERSLSAVHGRFCAFPAELFGGLEPWEQQRGIRVTAADEDGNAELIMVDSVPILYKNQPLRHAAMGMDINPKSSISKFASDSSSSCSAKIDTSSVSGFTNQLDELSFPTRANYNSDISGDLSKVKGFGICLSGSKKSAAVPSLDCIDTLLHKRKASKIILRPGMVLLKNHLTHEEQVEIVRICQTLGVGPGGFYQPGYKDGTKLDLRMMCLGLNWDLERLTYEFIRSVDVCEVPAIPRYLRCKVQDAWQSAISLFEKKIFDKEGNLIQIVDMEESIEIFPPIIPNVCIVNFYSAATGRLGLHQDCSESRMSLVERLSVISFSVGDSAEFLYGDEKDECKADKVILESGDVLLFGGESRHIYHGLHYLANYLPYGMDFINHQPTGRFCNGKLVVDFTAEILGFKTYPPAYLSPQAAGKNLLEPTSVQLHLIAIKRMKHLCMAACNSKYFKEYITKLAKVAGNKKASSIIQDALYILSAAATSVFGYGDENSNRHCLTRLNNDAQAFNKKLNTSAVELKKQLLGFVEAKRGCCGIRKKGNIVEKSSVLCKPAKSKGTCSNATQYVFWDSVHPSEVANQVVADAMAQLLSKASLLGSWAWARTIWAGGISMDRGTGPEEWARTGEGRHGPRNPKGLDSAEFLYGDERDECKADKVILE